MQKAFSERPPLKRTDVSVELDHFYVTDFTSDFDADVTKIAKKLSSAYAMAQASFIDGETMSTVHMLDGYHLEGHSQNLLRPVEVLQRMVAGADRAEVPLDYIIEEGGLVALAQKALELIRLQAEPVHESWEAHEWVQVETRAYENEKQTMEYVYGLQIKRQEFGGMAMHPSEREPEKWSWRIRQDIQLFNYKRKKDKILLNENGMPKGIEEWACPYLASISTMLRLGLMDVTPQLMDRNNLEDHDSWPSYPMVTQLNPDAEPFQAYTIFNVLPMQYLDVESASKLLVGAVNQDAMERMSHYFYPEW